MKKRALVFVLLLPLIFAGSLKAQAYLLAQEKDNDLLFLIGEGSTVRIEYAGYSAQTQEIKGRLLSISFDTLILKEDRLFKADTFKIAVQDITGYRPYTLGRIISKSVFELGLVGGNIALYHLVIVPAAIGAGPAIMLGIGTGLLSYGMIKILFPDKLKRTQANGWSFKVIRKSTPIVHPEF